MNRLPRYLALLALLMLSSTAYAKCTSSFMNPVTDVNWQCAFPMNIGGLVSFGSSGGSPDSDTEIANPVCSCLLSGGGTLIGANVAFWEPSRLVEVVKDPFCFPSLGTQLTNPTGGKLHGANDENNTTYQAHFFIYPLWAMLDLFLDVPCLAGNRVDGGGSELDLALMTEVLPNWNNDLLAFLLNPEALLFANPAAVMTCMADAASQAKGRPMEELFWCMGGWPGVYPVAGNIRSGHTTEAAATAAGRVIYQLGRAGTLLDHGMDSCAAVRTWIWRKKNYRFHFAQPVRGGQCLNFGTPTTTWETRKNKPVGGDNFSMVLFRRVKCCIGY